MIQLCAFVPLRGQFFATPRWLQLRSASASSLRFFAAAAFFFFEAAALARFFAASSSFDFARIVNQFDDRQLSVVAVAVAQFQDARVTAGPILVTLAEFVKEPLERSNARSSCRPELTALAGRSR